MQKKIEVNTDSLSLQEVFPRFVAHQIANGVSEKTVQTYKSHLHSISKHFDLSIPFADLTQDDINACIVSMRQSGLTREQIATAIYTIDKCRFPSEQQTSRLFDLISGTYRFVDNDSVIPDSDLIFLNDTEISERKNHIPVKQTKQLHTQQTSRSTFECSNPDFIELCDFLESVFMPGLLNPEMLYIQESDRYILTAEMKQRLHTLKTDQ